TKRGFHVTSYLFLNDRYDPVLVLGRGGLEVPVTPFHEQTRELFLKRRLAPVHRNVVVLIKYN
ncbi:hypothetical protein LCGC14_2170710, partial [marine sediment metagenome]